MQPTSPKRKMSVVWLILFIVLGVLNLVTVIAPLGLVAWLSYLAHTGVSGTEFAGLILAPVITAGYVTLGLNVILFIIYLILRRPRRVRLVLVIIGLVLSVGGIAYGIIGNIVSTKQYNDANAELSLSDATSLINSCHVRSIGRQKGSILFDEDPNKTKLILFIDERYIKTDDVYGYQKYAHDSDFDALKAVAEKASQACGEIDVSDLPENLHMEEITLEKATEMLQTCKLTGFYYTAQNEGETDAENSSTGILLAYKEDPIRIHIADRLIDTMVPIAREAQKACPNLQFWHDGRYEQKDENGNWE